jgi:hypothetical protein
MNARTIADDREPELETMEEDTIYYTRMLNQRMRRVWRQEGGNHGSGLVGRRS